MTQTQKRKPESERTPESPTEVRQGEKSKEARAKAEAMDELLDEIDSVLEDESLAVTYIQQGGE